MCKVYSILSAIVLLSLLASGCAKNKVYGSGLMVEDVRTVSGKYSAVTVDDGIKVIIDKDVAKNEIVIRCDEEFLPYVMVVIFLDKLTVRYKPDFTFTTDLTTELHVPDYSHIYEYELNESSMSAVDTVTRDSLKITAVQSHVSLPLNLVKLNASVSDNSTMSLQGIVRNSNVSLLSLSSYKGAQCKVDYLTAVLKNSTAFLWCDSVLNVKLSSKSKCTYKGACRTVAEISSDSELIQEK